MNGTRSTLDMVATLTGGRVETTGGNMLAAVVDVTGGTVLVTEDGGSFTVAYCTDHAGRDDAHDHAEHDEIRTALTLVEVVAMVRSRRPADVALLRAAGLPVYEWNDAPTAMPATECAVGTGAEHSAHTFATADGYVTCAGFVEPTAPRVWDWDGVHKDGCRCPVCR